jgi:hypothetical protein
VVVDDAVVPARHPMHQASPGGLGPATAIGGAPAAWLADITAIPAGQLPAPARSASINCATSTTRASIRAYRLQPSRAITPPSDA